MQRDRDYAAFQDDEQRFERRPSLWIEPLGEWGQGAVQLIEIPSDSEVNDNILAYWRPRAPMAAGSEVALAYRQYWCWTPPERPAARDRRGDAGRARHRRPAAALLRRFQRRRLGDAARPADLKPIADHRARSDSRASKLWPYPERKTVRVAFELDPGNENACEMRLVLEAGGKPISETWLYRWTP